MALNDHGVNFLEYKYGGLGICKKLQNTNQTMREVSKRYLPMPTKHVITIRHTYSRSYKRYCRSLTQGEPRGLLLYLCPMASDTFDL